MERLEPDRLFPASPSLCRRVAREVPSGRKSRFSDRVSPTDWQRHVGRRRIEGLGIELERNERPGKQRMPLDVSFGPPNGALQAPDRQIQTPR
jgi:hypothetical protein